MMPSTSAFSRQKMVPLIGTLPKKSPFVGLGSPCFIFCSNFAIANSVFPKKPGDFRKIPGFGRSKGSRLGRVRESRLCEVAPGIFAAVFCPIRFHWCFFPECVARVPVSLGGLGVRLCSPSFAFATATVRNRPQPSATACGDAVRLSTVASVSGVDEKACQIERLSPQLYWRLQRRCLRE